MNLRELYLADNKLNGLQDSAQLGNLLKFNCYIQILDLRNNHILDSGAEALSFCFPFSDLLQRISSIGSSVRDVRACQLQCRAPSWLEISVL